MRCVLPLSYAFVALYFEETPTAAQASLLFRPGLKSEGASSSDKLGFTPRL